ncbi:MAG: tellurite resistance TerB family protein [Acidobacteriota bacterium]|nr:tellurite resistance TerB family protein [Acidobacteriota bacterium]MDH3524710.1 tellurite resistance TerB family protein [Acidobacteriota bacterium]
MIDAERMLGSLVRGALSGGSSRGRRRRRRAGLLGSVGKGTLALGALGVAIGAFEHWTQKQAGGDAGMAGAGAAGGAAGPPPPPPPAAVELPPLPPLPAVDPPARQPSPPAAPGPASHALLLVRAMIAAANADHQLDERERERILEALEEADAGEEEKEFVRREMEEPIGPGALAAAADAPELAEQVYVASLLAIEVDTSAERSYLERLAQRLRLAPERARALEAMLESPASGPPEG